MGDQPPKFLWATIAFTTSTGNHLVNLQYFMSNGFGQLRTAEAGPLAAAMVAGEPLIDVKFTTALEDTGESGEREVVVHSGFDLDELSPLTLRIEPEVTRIWFWGLPNG